MYLIGGNMEKQSLAIISVLILQSSFFMLPLENASLILNDSINFPSSQTSTNKNDFGLFFENKGQWNFEFLYIGQTDFGQIALAKDCIYYNVLDKEYIMEFTRLNKYPDNNFHIKNKEININGSIIKINFEKSLTEKIIPSNLEKTNNNFFLGNDSKKWVTGVKSFKNIEYYNVWNGINIIFYIINGKLKYDILLESNSNPDDISFKVNGQTNLKVIGNELIISTPNKIDIIDGGLNAHYNDRNKKDIKIEYILKEKNIFSFSLFNYNPTRPVLIDPIVFSTFYGGADDDYPFDIDRDENGNLFILGDTLSNDFPTTSGSYKINNNGLNDIVLSKISSDGKINIFSTYIGGSKFDG